MDIYYVVIATVAAILGCAFTMVVKNILGARGEYGMGYAIKEKDFVGSLWNEFSVKISPSLASSFSIGGKYDYHSDELRDLFYTNEMFELKEYVNIGLHCYLNSSARLNGNFQLFKKQYKYADMTAFNYEKPVHIYWSVILSFYW